jgi:DNA-binding response OmpR family regulator
MGRKILVADDNIPSRKHLQSFLATQGFDVIAVGNGALAAQRAAEAHPELVILDTFMPGETGYEVCRRIRAELKLRTPVILIYDGREPFDRAEAMRVGADRAMQKPLDPFALLDTIRELWREYGQPDFESSASRLFATERGERRFFEGADDDDFEFLPLPSKADAGPPTATDAPAEAPPSPTKAHRQSAARRGRDTPQASPAPGAGGDGEG